MLQGTLQKLFMYSGLSLGGWVKEEGGKPAVRKMESSSYLERSSALRGREERRLCRSHCKKATLAAP